MEDMVSDFDAEGAEPGQMGPKGHAKNMSVDTDTILRNANLNSSIASEEVAPLGKNSLSIP